MNSEREELIKEIRFNESEGMHPGDPKYKDFIEADMSKIIAREKRIVAYMVELLKKMVFTETDGDCKQCDEAFKLQQESLTRAKEYL